MKIALGSDHGGIHLKKEIISYLESKEIAFEDCGAYVEESVDYPDYAAPVGNKVVNKEVDLGILVCGTGIGMSIAANKIRGIRAAVVSDEFSAKMSREHNNANILCLGERVVGRDLALSIIDAWLKASFQGSRHERRIKKIAKLEELL
ncbi:ribose 5-phosphate isomerase B [Shimazuella sp. AN120528]|uniref:ribose 5-phosphate isomerase B n=1 Tax=Shimazuella soli TaxID=1892854 RepID=UPI001F0F69EA|nr:ribose 5-phosphate isomerase B [Shimazuella soli]MCH5585191.1 ribose 5-phosphate isomerase B [Shimazuella soli]